jgi:hypothetical protein
MSHNNDVNATPSLQSTTPAPIVPASMARPAVRYESVESVSSAQSRPAITQKNWIETVKVFVYFFGGRTEAKTTAIVEMERMKQAQKSMSSFGPELLMAITRVTTDLSLQLH